ncbi:helix-hairpin-helix domain-containing protein [Lacticaseibacillus kribbianus]|uniref:helix-hairpin-helix domain-containing protein n=1 Tax=Lacticaseibacillus kribbianus TaxID=2926292 RepID=UPI001CD6BCC2|nr:helix-hairpin-helix domain-containing protein [Lacticaseibacillus kribbianus]
MLQVKQWARDYWYVPLLVVAGLAFWWWQSRAPVVPADSGAAESSSAVAGAGSGTATTAGAAGGSAAGAVSGAVSESSAKPGYVYLTGEVVHPGLYPITGTTRWDAVVKAAGGLTAKADVTQVNLAKVAVDEESLHIPAIGEAPPPATAAAGAAGSAAGSASAESALVNLNTATEAELETLSGIGPKKAADIIAYREENGGFKQIEDLKNVSGIGDKTFAALASSITVGP